MQEGKANYFKGLMLVLCYLIVGASFFVHSDKSNEGKIDAKSGLAVLFKRFECLRIVVQQERLCLETRHHGRQV